MSEQTARCHWEDCPHGANCVHAVPPTQPPAAPETDVRLTEAEREAVNVAVDEAETCVCCGDNYGCTHVYEAVERIVAERVRVVEGERDAWKLRTKQGYRRRSEIEEILDEVLGEEEVDGAGEGLVSDVRLAFDRLAARAESAEAAHRALQAAVAALADEWAGHLAGDEIRALLPGGEER